MNCDLLFVEIFFYKLKKPFKEKCKNYTIKQNIYSNEFYANFDIIKENIVM